LNSTSTRTNSQNIHGISGYHGQIYSFPDHFSNKQDYCP